MNRGIFIRATLAALLSAAAACGAGKVRKMSVHKAGGHDYVLLKDVARFYGFGAPVRTGDSITLKSKWTTLEVSKDSRMLKLNGNQVWMQSGSRRIKGNWAIPHDELLSTVDPVLRPYAHLKRAGTRTVVLDAGHGGEDSGALSQVFRIEEKDVALDLVKQVKSKLEKSGINVELTRDCDEALDLKERVEFAAELKADLFISIHLNSGTASGARGLETYMLSLPGFPSTNDIENEKPETASSPGNTFNAANMLLAYAVHNAVNRSGKQADRGLKRARFYVLKHAKCPAALIECGFLSNEEEELLMKDPKHLDLMASKISQGINHYLGQANKARLIEQVNLPAGTAAVVTGPAARD